MYGPVKGNIGLCKATQGPFKSMKGYIGIFKGLSKDMLDFSRAMKGCIGTLCKAM